MTIADLLDGNPHGRIFFAAQCHLDRVVHFDDFTGLDQGGPGVGKMGQGLG